MTAMRTMLVLFTAAILASPSSSFALGERAAARRTGQAGAANGSAVVAVAPVRPLRAPKTPTEAKARDARERALASRTVADLAHTRVTTARTAASDADQVASTSEMDARVARGAVTTATRKHEDQKAVVRTVTKQLRDATAAMDAATAAADEAVKAIAAPPPRATRRKADAAKPAETESAATAAAESAADAVELKLQEVARTTRAVATLKTKLATATRLRGQRLTERQAADAAAIAAGQKAEADRSRATALATEADGHASAHAEADDLAATVERDADELEARALDANHRYDQNYAAKDQRFFSLLGPNGVALRDRHRAAAQRWRSAGFVTSKPGKVSQDSFASNPEDGLFAISDGVTNSFASSQLSRALVRRWTAGPKSFPQHVADVPRWLEGAQSDWANDPSVVDEIEELRQDWYNKDKKFRADAAFVGGQIFRQGKQQKLRLVGVGDTVAILVRGGKLRRSFPLEESSEFTSYVKTLSSLVAPEHKIREQIWDVKPGDEIFMATDALGAWIHAEVELGHDPFPLLRGIKTRKQMDDFVTKARAGDLWVRTGVGQEESREKLQVDDTTLMRFTVPPLATR